MNAPEIWTAKDIAAWLGVCPRYVSEKLSKKDKNFPKPLPVGKYRWFKEEVLEWAENRKAV